MADRIVSWGGFDSKSTSGMGVTGSFSTLGNNTIQSGSLFFTTSSFTTNTRIYRERDGSNEGLIFRSAGTSGGYGSKFQFLSGFSGTDTGANVLTLTGNNTGTSYNAHFGSPSGSNFMTNAALVGISTFQTSSNAIWIFNNFNTTNARSYIQFSSVGYGAGIPAIGTYIKHQAIANNYGGHSLVFGVNNNSSATNETDILTVNLTGIGVRTNSPSATIHAVGSGTTSSTTALLVQNANASSMLSLTDNGTLTVNTFQTSSTAFTINRTNATMGSGFNAATMGTLVTINDTVTNSNGSKTTVYINTTGASSNNAVEIYGGVGIGISPNGSSFNVAYPTIIYNTNRTLAASTFGLSSRSSISTYDAGNGGGISFWGDDRAQGNGNSAFAGIRGVKENSTYINSLGNLVFYVQTSSASLPTETTFRETARFNSLGYFGIGVSNPTYTLDVSGSGDFSGNLTVTGSLILSGSNVSTAWTSYTPTWEGQVSNPSLGDGSITGAYKVIGKTCFVRIKLNYGSTTSGGSGAWWFGLPFTGSNADGIQMACSMLDNGNAWYQGIANGTYAGYAHKTAIISQSPGSNSSQGVDLGFPFVWGNTDSLQFAGSYEIA